MRYESFYPFARQQPPPASMGQMNFGPPPQMGQLQAPIQPFMNGPHGQSIRRSNGQSTNGPMGNPIGRSAEQPIRRSDGWSRGATSSIKNGIVYANGKPILKHSPAIRTDGSTIRANGSKLACNVEIV